MIEKQDRTIEKIQEFKFLADSIPQIVWTSNPDGSPAYYNKYYIDFTGRTVEDTVAYGWETILHPEDVDSVAEIWGMALSSGKPYEKELRLKGVADGSFKWYKASAVPMRDERGKITKWFGSCTDIDEYKRALDLENRISQFEDFNRIVAHNLRGPAGSINAMLAMMGEAGDDEERDHLVKMMQQSSDTLTATLNELMKVLEVRNNRNINFDDCDLIDMVESVERMLRGQIISSKAVISTDFAVPSMKFPKMYLESIFYNMMSNALKYSKANVPPHIIIGSKKVNGKTVLTFADNGLGIDLFKHGNAMFKLNSTFHKGFDSSGVGLFMTKTQIETFGGNITVESEPDVGTTFTVIF